MAKFSELLIKILEKPNEDLFYFKLLPEETSKKEGKKNAYMKLLINDEIAQHIFDNLHTEVRFVICIPRKQWEKAIEEVN